MELIFLNLLIAALIFLPAFIILHIYDKLRGRKSIDIPKIKLSLSDLKSFLIDIYEDMQAIVEYAKYLATHPTKKGIDIFFIVLFTLIAIIFIQSSSKELFFINSIKVFLIVLATFIIYPTSYAFWFVHKKKILYKQILEDTKLVKDIFLNMGKASEVRLANPQKVIEFVTRNNGSHYRTNLKRYGLEISTILIILLFTAPLFTLLNIILFFFMFFYVYLNDFDANEYVIAEIESIIQCIQIMYRKNSRKCWEYIYKSENTEILELKKLYTYIIIHDKNPHA